VCVVCVSKMSTAVRRILELMCSNNLDHKHALNFIEDLKIDGEKEAVCQVCEEPPSGSGYKCSECNFLCHKSCFDLPDEIQHPIHPNHNLTITAPLSSDYCVACGKCCGRCFTYWCNRRSCDFQIDIKCSSRWRVNKDDCHQHAYVPIWKNIQFTCQACGEEGKDTVCLYCTICQLLIHSNCSSFSRTIKIRDHDHPLKLIYSVHQVKEHAGILCELCYKEVQTEYAIYYCQECNYAAHLRCTRGRDLRKDMNAMIGQSAQVGFISNVTGIIKDINRAENQKDQPPEIKHFSHQHDLIINYEEVKIDKLCDGCMQLISPPFYSCIQCNFFLHNICAKLPTKATHPLVSFPMTLLSHAPFSNGLFRCFFCEQYRHGFAYKDEVVGHLFDIQCWALQETFQHEAHQHPLFFTERALDQNCKFCEEPAVFVCSPCNFFLGFICVTLPPTADHKYDEHPLKLTAEDKSEEYYCLICEQERNPNHLFYYCAKCDFSAHPRCVIGKYPYVKFGKTYNDKHHQHPLTFVRKTEYSSLCDGCGCQFDEVALECTQCKLAVHPKFPPYELYDEDEEENDCLEMYYKGEGMR
jgi:hypothetical protein